MMMLAYYGAPAPGDSVIKSSPEGKGIGEDPQASPPVVMVIQGHIERDLRWFLPPHGHDGNRI
jgi:hypothetical protein